VAQHEPIKGVVDKDSAWFDVGKIEQLKEAEKFLALNPLYL
jgi:NDP-sugar pyrophosphorylase family protein